MKFNDFPRAIQNMNFFKLVLLVAALLAVILFVFIDPRKLDASDFLLIAWYPGQELLTTGSIHADYPYPLWTVLVMLPFVVWPPQTSMLLWFICNVLMLAASLVIFMRLFEWNVSPVFFISLVLLGGYFLPVLTSLWLGQLTIFSLLILALTAYMFKTQRWGWLGIMLGLSFIKPQVMILLAGLLLLWALWQRRWGVLLGFGAVILLLTLISLPFISSPGQIIGGGISSHLGTYLRQTSTLWGLFLNLGMSWPVPLAISLALLAWLGWVWLPFLRGTETSSGRILFLFSAATLVNLMAIPYSWMHNLSLLLLPLGYSLTRALKIKSGARLAWLTLLFFIMHPLLLGLFIAFSEFDHTQAFQIIPALALLPIMLFLESRTKLLSS
ncbi:MAG: DUF2029 domain-containing protein [Chloroflexi bacterium]|nr:DUF2029 domain-containing protein [Chloroflexota bacterium]